MLARLLVPRLGTTPAACNEKAMEEAEDPELHKEAGQEGPGEGRGRDQHYKNIWNSWVLILYLRWTVDIE